MVVPLAPGQSASVTVSGPSVVTASAAEQLTLARFASIETEPMLVAVITSASRLGVDGAVPQVFVSLVYGIAGTCPPVSTPAPVSVAEATGSPLPNPSDRTSIVPIGADPLPSRSATAYTQ